MLKGSLPEVVGEGLIEPPLDFWPIWLKAWASGDLGSKCRSAVQKFQTRISWEKIKPQIFLTFAVENSEITDTQTK